MQFGIARRHVTERRKEKASTETQGNREKQEKGEEKEREKQKEIYIKRLNKGERRPVIVPLGQHECEGVRATGGELESSGTLDKGP